MIKKILSNIADFFNVFSCKGCFYYDHFHRAPEEPEPVIDMHKLAIVFDPHYQKLREILIDAGYDMQLIIGHALEADKYSVKANVRIWWGKTEDIKKYIEDNNAEIEKTLDGMYRAQKEAVENAMCIHGSQKGKL